MAKTILQKIEDLQYWDGLRSMKEVLKNIFSSVTELETNSVLLGEVTQVNTNQTSGTLIVGEVYTINTVATGDNFANVGKSGNTTFVATGTTPTVWTNGTTVTRNQRLLRVDFNDIDENYTTKTVIGAFSTPTCRLTITNNKFSDPLKVFATNVTATVENSNNILLSIGRFKLEVYN